MTSVKHARNQVWTAWPGEIVSVPDPEFERVFDRAEPDVTFKYKGRYKGMGVIDKISRCFMLKSILLSLAPIEHHVAECGVYRGLSAYVMAYYLQKFEFGQTASLHLFDSWEGLPEPDGTVDNLEGVETGMYAATEEYVKGHLSEFDFIQMHKGFIPDSLSIVESKKFSFVHIDLNLYHSYLDSLRFFWPRLQVPGVIVFDDYGFPDSSGSKMAVDEFCANRGLHPVYLPTGQAVLWRLH